MVCPESATRSLLKTSEALWHALMLEMANPMAATGNKRATNSTKKKPLDGRTKAGKVMSGKYDAKKK